ncbi:LacI family DNA-binding transcriptional regulator [Variovorax sp. OV329]|uniref:LacI family DNA-binding transcriptional regulator n=1 Tax=Variovorax sp. OV329 TaxID=1882825 RepID=UPI0008E3E9C1|nr:LacI family DNA-binding transcriptional regulator [Variovorax sp. OV329]SFN29245.1 transcriptional regulator, LacI family [Variovorax sp. OV329]
MTRSLPGVADVARLAGVSTATVDRVLHRRPGVRQATVQRVVQAAAELDYLPRQELHAALAPEPMQLLFVLPDRSSRFLRMLGEWVGYSQEHWAPFNVNCKTAFIQSFDPEALAALLRRRGQRVDGVAFMALEHPLVREAVDRLAEQGVPSITLVSDLSHSQRVAYVGLDNRAAGRTAAYLIGRFLGPARRAKVAMIAGSLSYRAHEEREAGFMQLLAEQYPQLQVLDLREGYDDERTNYRQTRAMLEQHTDLAAIYNIGGGAEGVGRALKESGLEHRVVFIGHGLTPDTRALLIDGTMDAVINQSPQSAILTCVRIFTNLRDRRDMMSGVEATRSQVIFRENLP